MTKYRIVKGSTPGIFNIERSAGDNRDWFLAGVGAASLDEAKVLVEDLKAKEEAAKQWAVGEVVWHDGE